MYKRSQSIVLGFVLGCGLTLSALSQTTTAIQEHRRQVATLLGFEPGEGTGVPSGWGAQPPETVHRDNKVMHSGSWSVRIDRTSSSSGNFSALTQKLPVDFQGRTITLSGYLRTRDVAQWTGLWLREDGETGTIALDNMQKQAVSGNREWQQYSLTLPLDAKATSIYFGVLLSGTGSVWADDLELLVDGKPIAEASSAPVPAPTILDLDHEFDKASRIALARLSPGQIENLVLTAQVWGYLKYRHPTVTSGQRHWDYELLRHLPALLAAPDRPATLQILNQWVESLGPVASCEQCAPPSGSSLALAPDLAWIHDRHVLGEKLSRSLEALEIRRNSSAQFYVSLTSPVLNPDFEHELTYTNISFPDSGFQLLALFRFWNMIQYWSPNRQAAKEDWVAVLRSAIPSVGLATSKESFTLAMLSFVTHLHDSHSNLWGSLTLRPPRGECRLPVNVRFIGDQPVVTTPTSSKAASVSGLQRGDILNDIDGTPVSKLVEAWSPWYAASNEASRLRDLATSFTNGTCGPAKLIVSRGSAVVPISTERLPIAGMDQISYTHDIAGPAFQLLTPDAAYLKLSSIKAADIPDYLEQAARTKGLIIDIRNYPSEFVPFALGSHFITHATPFATFSVGDLADPGTFTWGGEPAVLTPAEPLYRGRVIILVDEISQSQAEYTVMALRATPHALVIGSATAGADGNVSAVPLLSDLRSLVSGIGVFYPDRTPTQRIGIIPDIEVRPTLQGIRDGRDEVLEKAVEEAATPVPSAASKEFRR